MQRRNGCPLATAARACRHLQAEDAEDPAHIPGTCMSHVTIRQAPRPTTNNHATAPPAFICQTAFWDDAAWNHACRCIWAYQKQRRLCQQE